MGCLGTSKARYEFRVQRHIGILNKLLPVMSFSDKFCLVRQSLQPVFRIRMDPHSICLLDPDPDPATDEISSKSKKNFILFRGYLTNLKKILSCLFKF